METKLAASQERILTMMTSIQAKEAAWKTKEEKSLASLRSAQDRVASLQMALKIKEDEAWKALKGNDPKRQGENQVKVLTVQLKEEKSNLYKMGIIVKSLEETISRKEEKVEMLQTENNQLKEKEMIESTGRKKDIERMDALVAKAKDGEAVAKEDLKKALEAKSAAEMAKLAVQKTIKNINGAKDAAEKKALKLDEKVSTLELTLAKTKTEVKESKEKNVDLKKEVSEAVAKLNNAKKEMSGKEESHKEEVNLLKERLQRGSRPPGPPGPPGPPPTDAKTVQLQKLNTELELKMKENKVNALKEIAHLQKSNSELESKLKEKEEISDYVKELEEKQTEGEMKMIEEVEQSRKAQNVKDKIIANLKADNDDLLKKVDIADMKVISSKERESNLIESGNKMMEELKKKDEEAKIVEKLKCEKIEKEVANKDLKENTENINISKAAFLQCGIIPPMMSRDLKIEKISQEEILAKYEEKIKDINQKLSETEKSWKEKLFEKEDHFEREIEVLRRENKRIKEHLKEEKKIHNLEETRVNGDNLEGKVEVLQKERNGLITEIREKEERVEELLEETGDLNKSIEVEKNERCNLESELVELRKSVEGRVKRATVMHNLDLETLRSELERTRLKVKEAQEVGLAAYTDVFEEHDELLTALRTIPSRKRKRLVNQMFKSKRTKLSRKAGKSKKRLGPSKKDKTLQIDNQDIDISEILFEEEEEVEEQDDEQEAMLTQEEQELAELEIELNAMDNSAPPRAISPPLTEKDFAQALLASTPPSKVELFKGSKGSADIMIDEDFSAPKTLDDLISALDFEFS